MVIVDFTIISKYNFIFKFQRPKELAQRSGYTPQCFLSKVRIGASLSELQSFLAGNELEQKFNVRKTLQTQIYFSVIFFR